MTATERLRFDFEMTPLDRFEPWSQDQPVHWYALSDGEYVVRVGNQRIFESESSGVRRALDYQVAKLLQDVLEVLPHTLEPVPPRIACRLDPDMGGWFAWSRRAAPWYRTLPDDGTLEAMEEAFYWVQQRTLDAMYLVGAPRLTFVCVGDATIATCEPAERLASADWQWLCEPARVELPRTEFVAEVRRFGHAFIAAMAERIDACERGALRGRAVIDVPALRDQHAAAEAEFAAVLAAPPTPQDWGRVEQALIAFDEAMAAPQR